MPEKQVRCKARKHKTTCEKDPDVCVWNDGKCDYLHSTSKQAHVNTTKEVQNTKNKSVASEELHRMKQLRLRMRLRSLVQPFTHKNVGDMKSRLRMYEVAKKYLDNSKKCLTWDSDSKRLLMGDAIDLTNRIGSPSLYGIVYLTKGKGMARLIKVACKMMTTDAVNKHELDILDRVSKEVVNNNFMNFPLLYSSIHCDTPVCTKDIKDCPYDILKHKYMVVFSELADGDLKQWIHQQQPNRTTDAYISALFQIYMGLAKLGSMKYKHNDMHWGNALYHTVPPGGWWWYRVAGKDYYIRNTGQLWVLWDFGLVKKTRINAPPGTYAKTDFLRIINAFIDIRNGGWVGDAPIHDNVVSIAKSIKDYISADSSQTFTFDNIMQHVLKGVFPQNKKRNNEPKFNVRIPVPITLHPPRNDRVLNDTPFVIA